MNGLVMLLLVALVAADLRRRRAESRAEEAGAALAELERYHVARVADLHLRLELAGASRARSSASSMN